MLILAAGVASPGAARSEFVPPIAIVGARIVTGTGEIVDPGTIVMDDGVIVAVGVDVEVPAHAERLEGTGLVVYPGFINAQSHLGIPEDVRSPEERQRTEDLSPDPKEGVFAATRRANRRGIRPQYRAAEAWAPSDKAIETARRAGFTTALVAPRWGILGGTSALINLTGEPVRRSLLSADVAQHGSFDPGEPGRYPGSLLGVFAHFRQVMSDARWYVEMRRYAERHPRHAVAVVTDPALEALQPLLSRRVPLMFEANTEREIRRALNLAAEHNLRIIISGAREAWKAADQISADRAGLVVSLKFDEEPEFGRRPDPRKKKTPDGALPDEEVWRYEPLRLRRERRRLWEEQVANVVRLHEAGVGFALRTADLKKPDELLGKLRLVMQRGLPPEAALKALTAEPARLLGVAHRLGRLTQGMVANLTVLSAPLEDEKAEVRYVIIGGKRFPVDVDLKAQEGGDEADHDPERDSDVAAGAAANQPPGSPTEVAGAAVGAPEAKEEDERGPDFAVELEADRVPSTRTGGNVLIKNATVLPVVSDPLPNCSILAENGKIVAIGPDLTAPPGVTVIDATGRFVMPGMVDCHSHMALDAVNEMAEAISAEVRTADVLDNTQVQIYRALAGGVTTIHTMHGSGNPIGGQNTILKLKYDRPVKEMILPGAPRTIKFALGENVTQTNSAKRLGKRFPDTRMGVESVFRRAFVEARRYVAEKERYREAVAGGADLPPPRPDLRLAALADVLAGKLAVHCHGYRADEFLRLLAVAEEFGFRVAVLQHVLEGYRIAPEIARHGCGASTFANFWAYKIEAYGAIPHNAALMTRHGICVSVNSDSAAIARRLNVEAAKCIKWGGLNPNEALRLVTLNPARQLGIEQRVGSIEVGHDADLAIFNGHPLNALAECVMTLIEGEVYFEHAAAPGPAPAMNPPPGAEVDMTIPRTEYALYAITGGTVHPVSGPPIPEGTVVIRNQRIDAVGPAAEVPVPPGAGVIDATGRHVYPGMIVGGGTLGLEEIGALPQTRDHRDSASFDADLRASSALNPHSAHVRTARTVGITTALVQPSGARVAGQSAVVQLDGWTAPQMILADPWGLHVRVPVLPVHVPVEPKEERRKLLKEHRKALRELEAFFTRADRYAVARSATGDVDALVRERDVVLEAMIPYVGGEKPVAFEADTFKEIVKSLEFAKQYHLRAVISGGDEAWKLADELARRKVPVMLRSVLDYPRGKFEPWESVYACAAVLDRAGVPFCFATRGAADAIDLSIHAGLAAAHGLDPLRAEYALTLGAAKMLGLDDRIGSLEPGKRADVIVTTHSPIQTVCRVTHMFIAGRPIELTSKHTEEYERFRHRPSPQLPPIGALRGPPSLTGR